MVERIATRQPLEIHHEVPRSRMQRSVNPVRILHSQLEPALPDNVISIEDFERSKFIEAFEAEFYEQFFEDNPQEMPSSGFLKKVRENVLARYPDVQEVWKREDERAARKHRHYMKRTIIRKGDWIL